MEFGAPPTRKYCLPCWKARSDLFRATHPEKTKAYKAKAYAKIKAARAPRARKPRSTLCCSCKADMGVEKSRSRGYCKPCAAAYMREHRAAHPDKMRAANARSYAKHGAVYCRTLRDRPVLDPVGYAAYRTRVRQWCRANRATLNISEGKVRARRAGATGSHTVAEWKSVLRHFKRLCVYCGTKLTTANISKDHVVPLKRLGSNSIRNIVPACRRCNSRKHTMTGAEFRKHLETKS